jgi:hypothetical protein
MITGAELIESIHEGGVFLFLTVSVAVVGLVLIKILDVLFPKQIVISKRK